MYRAAPLVVFLIFLTAACAERREGNIVVQRGRLDLEPRQIDFGSVLLGDRVTEQIRIENGGGDVLSICLPRIVEEGCPAASGVVPREASFEWPLRDMRWSLGVAESAQFTIGFAPQRAGPFVTALELAHDGADGPVATITLTGEGILPDVAFSTDALDFGSVPLGTTALRSFEIENRTDPPVAVTVEIVTTGTDAFNLAGDPVVTVLPGDTASVPVELSLEEERFFQGKLTLTYCPQCRHEISLGGLGVAPRIAVAPTELVFPPHDSTVAEVAGLEIRSTGSSTLTVTGLVVSTDVAAEFNVTARLPLVLPPGSTATVAVAHRGRVPGIDVGSLTVLSDAWMQPETPVSLVAESHGPNIQIEPRSVDFGVVVPQTSLDRTVLVRNIGDRPLSVSGAQISPPGRISADFGALPATVEPNEALPLTINFAPDDFVRFDATLVVASDDADEPTVSVPLTGLGGDPDACALSPTPASVVIGRRERGVWARHRVLLTNYGPTDCNVSQAVLSGDAAITIAAGTPAQLVVPGNGVASIPIELFTPSYGLVSASLSVTSDDPNQAVATVPISAEAAPEGIRFAPTHVDFGKANPNCRSRQRSVFIHNDTAAGIDVEAVSMNPATPAAFELTPVNVPTTIAPGAAFEIPMRYRPTDTGTGYGLLDVRVNGVDSSIPLRGEGVAGTDLTESFQQRVAATTDVLFVVNNDNQTGNERDDLAAAFPSFLAFAQAEGVDYRIATTSMDLRGNGEQGRFLREQPQQEAIHTPQSVDAAGAFASNVDENGGGNAEGMRAAFLALSDPLLVTDNTGFSRPDALLTVIYVSDEDDESDGDRAAYHRHLEKIVAAKGGRFQALGVVGTEPGVCFSQFGRAEYAPVLIAAIDETGGIAVDMCEDQSQTIPALAPYAFGRTRRFGLTGAPVAPSIQVTVDGSAVPRTDAQGVVQWSYSSQVGAVLFSEPATPPLGANVEITYSLECL